MSRQTSTSNSVLAAVARLKAARSFDATSYTIVTQEMRRRGFSQAWVIPAGVVINSVALGVPHAPEHTVALLAAANLLALPIGWLVILRLWRPAWARDWDRLGGAVRRWRGVARLRRVTPSVSQS
ncbi:MAG: hypothetical protein GC206_10455 [Alphaproteobacteria bacterium]|nr:hypothetical protein [Alphaproteobacteria bacterium]